MADTKVNVSIVSANRTAAGTNHHDQGTNNHKTDIYRDLLQRDRAALSRFVLIVMEGAVMQTRVYGDVSHFDCAVTELRDYLNQRGFPDRKRLKRPQQARALR